MKHLRNLLRRHKVFLSDLGLDPNEFYVSKDTSTFTEFVDKKGNVLRMPISN